MKIDIDQLTKRAFIEHNHQIVEQLKTVSVLAEDDQKWTVSPHLLTPVQGANRKMQLSGTVRELPPKESITQGAMPKSPGLFQ